MQRSSFLCLIFIHISIFDDRFIKSIKFSYFSWYRQLRWSGAPAWLRVGVPVPGLADWGHGGQGGGGSREAGWPQQRPGREQIPREGQVAGHVRRRPSPSHCKFQNSFDDPSIPMTKYLLLLLMAFIQLSWHCCQLKDGRSVQIWQLPQLAVRIITKWDYKYLLFARSHWVGS